MRVNERYQDVKSGKITELLFLEEARKDGTLRKFISSGNTFEEAVTILRNKNLLFEDVAPKTEKLDFFKMFNEGIAAWEVEQDKSAEVNPFEFEKGWRFEYIKAGKTDEKAVEKAKDKAVKNIQKDPIFYTKLELVKDSVEHQKKRTDQPLDISKGQNLVDKDNQSKPVKVKADISSEDYLKAAKEKEEAILNESAIREFSEFEYEHIDDEYGTDEVRAILKKWDYLGFDSVGEAMNDILQDRDWKETFDVSDENIQDLQKVTAWRSEVVKKVKLKEDKLPGGEGDKLKPEDVDPKELEIGIKHEMEHTKDKAVAQEIALDHLSEDPKYYTTLKTAGIDEGVFSNDPLGKLKGKEISFTTKNGDQLNSVSAKAVSSKLDKGGSWIITLAGNQTLAITKNGTKGVYFKTKDQHEKVADLGQDLKATADKVFKEGSLKEGTKPTLPGGWKVLPISKDHKVTKEKPEGYGIFMTDPKDDFYFDHGSHRDTDEIYKTEKEAEDIFNKTLKTPGTDINSWAKKHSELKEQIKAVLREKLLKEYTGSLPTEEGPDVDRKTLEHELKNYDWYWQNSDDAYLKKLAQQRDDKVRKLVDKMGEDGVKLYNEYAPKDLQWDASVKEKDEAKPQLHQDIKDMEDMDPKDLAKMVLDKGFAPASIKNKAAAMLLANAMKTDKDPSIKDAFLKLAGK